MTTLYYTVEKETHLIDEIEECTGWKTICVYEIANDKPKIWFDIAVLNDVDSEGSIQDWLDDNGYGGRDYKFKKL